LVEETQSEVEKANTNNNTKDVEKTNTNNYTKDSKETEATHIASAQM
jgi:hypothetical protein